MNSETAQQAGTVVLDAATLIRALSELAGAIRNQDGPGGWHPQNDHQYRLLRLVIRYNDAVQRLSRLQCKTSANADVLNQFLVENNFPPRFREIAPGGIGVAAVLDMLVRWIVEGKVAQVDGRDGRSHRAFKIPQGGIRVYRVPGHNTPLVELPTQERDSVWLMVTDRPADQIAPSELAAEVLAAKQPDYNEYAGVIIPTLEIDLEFELDWLKGLIHTVTGADSHIIDQAFQIFKLRMNEHGAHLRVATGVATMRGISFAEPIVFDRPFAGWFTQPESNVPIGAFWAGYDSWREPQGALEDL